VAALREINFRLDHYRIFAKQTVYLRPFIFLLFCLIILTGSALAQNDSGLPRLQDTLLPRDSSVVHHPIDSVPVKPPDSARPLHREPVQRVHRDSLPIVTTDTATVPPLSESVSRKPFYPTWNVDRSLPLYYQVLQHHPYFPFNAKPVIVHSDLRTYQGKEIFFYGLIGLLFAFALLRQAFPKYFNDMFRLLFRNTLKQKQIKEQLMQTPLPSLLLNFFFVITGGLYVDLLLHHYGMTPIENFWLLMLYCSLGLAIVYFIKFIGLKVTGWLFNLTPVADSYIFVVFIINKVIGIFLLPFLVLLTFMDGNAYTIAMMLSWCGIGVLYIYRFLLTYASIRNQVRFNPFHFFLYLCAFEVAPLLLIYKALLFVFP
jgi:hypothetical protein